MSRSSVQHSGEENAYSFREDAHFEKWLGEGAGRSSQTSQEAASGNERGIAPLGFQRGCNAVHTHIPEVQLGLSDVAESKPFVNTLALLAGIETALST